MKHLEIGNTVFDRMTTYSSTLAGAMLVFIMLSVSVDVIRRKTFGSSAVWIMEVTEYLLLFLTMLGSARVLREEGHVKVDLVLNRLHPRPKAILNLSTSVLALASLLIVEYYSIETTISYFKLRYFTPTPLRLPQAAIMAIIPVGILMLLIQLLKRTRGLIETMKETNKGTR